uniref:RING-type E3 ubiquitin transferase n=1 Tax=Leersia perrieri TaxID=77586 RepID=A0A0D9VHD4_9ORYZ
MGRRVRSLCLVLLLLVVVGGGFYVANAQESPPQPPLRRTATSTVSRTVSTAITVVIGLFFLLVFLCVIVNQCCDSSGAGAGGHQGQSAVVRRGRRGLDPATVAAIPIVPYAEIRKHRSGGLECAVCLTAFDDGDDLRLLPRCSHAFHPDCIDPWLEGHVTCPLCRANLEKQPPPSPPADVEFTSTPPPRPPAAIEADEVRLEVAVEAAISDEEERRREEEEEAAELERLRAARRAARMPRSHSTGHSLCTLPARASPSPSPAEEDHERFTVRLPPHVREEVLKSRRLRHATSLVLGVRGSSREGSSRGGGAGGSWHGARRWPSFVARTVSWARGGGVGGDSSAKGTGRACRDTP